MNDDTARFIRVVNSVCFIREFCLNFGIWVTNKGTPTKLSPNLDQLISGYSGTNLWLFRF